MNDFLKFCVFQCDLVAFLSQISMKRAFLKRKDSNGLVKGADICLSVISCSLARLSCMYMLDDCSGNGIREKQ